MGNHVYDLDSIWDIYAAGDLPAYVRETETGSIIRYNDALAELTGYPHAEVPHMEAWFEALYPDARQRRRARKLVAEFVSGKRDQYEEPMAITRRDGSVREVEFHVNQMVHEPERPCLHLVTVIDLADRAAATRQLVHLNRLLDQMIQERTRLLEDHRQRLALALEGADEGIWEIDFKGGRMHFTSEIPQMLGYGLDELGTTSETWDKLNHPEDWPTVEKALKAHFKGRTDHYEAEYRVRAKNGEWRWIMGRGRVTQRDARGRPLKAVGTHVNIDKIKRAEEELKLKSARLEEMNTALRVLLAQRDADRTEMEEKILSNVKTLVAPLPGPVGVHPQDRPAAQFSGRAALQPGGHRVPVHPAAHGQVHELHPPRDPGGRPHPQRPEHQGHRPDPAHLRERGGVPPPQRAPKAGHRGQEGEPAHLPEDPCSEGRKRDSRPVRQGRPGQWGRILT